MKRSWSAERRVVIALGLLALAACGGSSTAREVAFAEVATASGTLRFPVEIADDAAERMRGLSNRDYLAPGTGMLFVFDPPAPRRFWMKETRIPLDIIFADRTGQIVMIAPNRTPYSLEAVGPDGIAVALVLELNGGEAEEFGIAVGDRLSQAGSAN